ncbi:MAG: undecaprenyldiphospho-muramoylpentapeptide beta-N-acetylglucosaminyltransferase [Gammaproteobacteria bacterium]|nr:undecaprenyldiphospho-muramoylpentapeptide beta-N-acetylglucosaminyltransferase [Gammaproteobacteria bacterium]
MNARPVLIAAGGTGGHVFPGLAVADALKARDIPVIWVGTPYGLESRVIPEAGVPFAPLSIRGLRGNGLFGWLLAPWRIMRALIGAVMLLRRYQPRVVLGMGGYVAGPVGLAAWLLRRPLVIHEQNAIAGMTNRWLSRLAVRVLTGLHAEFPQATDVLDTGNPIRSELTRHDDPEVRYAARGHQPPRVLVLGGSLGARSLNQVMPAAFAKWPADQRPEIVHQAGERTVSEARAAYASAGVDADVRVFIADMQTVYDWADLVVARAGALTVSELAAAGVPALLVPFPHAVDDHQTANAQFLVNARAAELMPDAQLEPDAVFDCLQRLLADRNQLAEMACRAQRLAQPRAAERVADECLAVAA